MGWIVNTNAKAAAAARRAKPHPTSVGLRETELVATASPSARATLCASPRSFSHTELGLVEMHWICVNRPELEFLLCASDLVQCSFSPCPVQYFTVKLKIITYLSEII